MNQDLMKEAGFEKEIEKVNMGLCPFCNQPAKVEDFRNAISRREFKISGMCQKCQDKIFGKD